MPPRTKLPVKTWGHTKKGLVGSRVRHSSLSIVSLLLPFSLSSIPILMLNLDWLRSGDIFPWSGISPLYHYQLGYNEYHVNTTMMYFVSQGSDGRDIRNPSHCHRQ